jgi:hypothetical protein
MSPSAATDYSTTQRQKQKDDTTETSDVPYIVGAIVVALLLIAGTITLCVTTVLYRAHTKYTGVHHHRKG